MRSLFALKGPSSKLAWAGISPNHGWSILTTKKDDRCGTEGSVGRVAPFEPRLNHSSPHTAWGCPILFRVPCGKGEHKPPGLAPIAFLLTGSLKPDNINQDSII